MAGWTLTGPLRVARALHSATALLNGKVLVYGGYDFSVAAGAETQTGLRSAELYDPRERAWMQTGSAFYERVLHTANLLPDGKVLMTGGTRHTELYDPNSGQFYATGQSNQARAGHAGVALADGRVLVLGGSVRTLNVFNPFGWTNSAEIYDPATQTWTNTGDMSVVRFQATATRLADGSVLVVGGTNFDSDSSVVEVFDPRTGKFSVTGSLFYPRWSHSATLLPDGRVLVAGGRGLDTSPAQPGPVTPPLDAVEVYNPASGDWYTVGKLRIARGFHAATALADGTVLITGGITVNPATSGASVVDQVESFDPTSLVWTTTSTLNTPRFYHSATLLSEPGSSTKVEPSSILVAGGVPGMASQVVVGTAEVRIEPPR
jgi:hypothetical protein